MLRYIVFFFLIFQGVVQAADSSLAQSPSPYLRAHADDNVRWQLLSHDAIQQAKSNNQLILLSSGYSSCNWCYRMKETFKDGDTAEYINQHFVPIMIDRELEPEVDQYLQHFMEQIRGFGGWPVTVVFSPDALPIFGFNYMRPAELQDLLKRFIKDWEANSEQIQKKAKERHDTAIKKQQQDEEILDKTDAEKIVKTFIEQAQSAADNQYGGFGESEKFPYLPQLQALLKLQQTQPSEALLNFLNITTTAMLGSSLRDHLGGGFFRYTSDRKWTYPHYEQMLYTQALMAEYLLDISKTFKQPRFAEAAKTTLLHMVTQFRREDGLFRASLSATGVDGKAGTYYLWDQSEITDIIGKQATPAIHNLLGDEAKKVLPFLLSKDKSIQPKLLEHRNKRKLSTDDKALLGWNALALSALAKGSHLDPKIKQATDELGKKLHALAEKSIQDLPKLIDSSNADKASLSDYAYLAKGLQDWAAMQDDKDGLDKTISALLLETHKKFYTNKGWLKNTTKPLIGKVSRLAIQDRELPSPSAMWLQSVWQLDKAEGDAKELHALAEQVSARIPQAVEDNAFFHAGLITALVGR